MCFLVLGATFTKKWFEFPNFEPALAKNWENSIQPTYFVGYNFPEPKIWFWLLTNPSLWTYSVHTQQVNCKKNIILCPSLSIVFAFHKKTKHFLGFPSVTRTFFQKKKLKKKFKQLCLRVKFICTFFRVHWKLMTLSFGKNNLCYHKYILHMYMHV